MWGELSSECGASRLGASFVLGEFWDELSLGHLKSTHTRKGIETHIQMFKYRCKNKQTYINI